MLSVAYQQTINIRPVVAGVYRRVFIELLTGNALSQYYLVTFYAS
jgi:hypothetical protein